MILTLLASFAQEESRSVSENMKWRIKKDFEQGIIWGGNSCLGYKLINKQLHKIDEEAKTVQMIYELYLDGYSDNEICSLLNDKGIKPYKSKAWHRTSVMKILTNYNYTGDLLLQKTYRDNHLNKLQKINDGVLNQYVVSDNHETIVSKEIFNKAQTIRQSKTENHQFSNKKEHDYKGLIKCGLCHKAYTVKHSNMIRFGCVQPLEQRVKQYVLLNKYQLRKSSKDLTKYLILNPLMRGCLDQK